MLTTKTPESGILVLETGNGQLLTVFHNDKHTVLSAAGSSDNFAIPSDPELLNALAIYFRARMYQELKWKHERTAYVALRAQWATRLQEIARHTTEAVLTMCAEKLLRTPISGLADWRNDVMAKAQYAEEYHSADVQRALTVLIDEIGYMLEAV